jgi:hypothetical protein
MSSNLKSPPEGLKPSECKKRKSVARPPISYAPPLDLIKKWETKQIKVKMPNGTNFGMSAFAYGTNKDYLIHIIAILRMIKKKGLASDIKVAWDAIIEVRREMKPYFQFPEDETKTAKEIRKQMLSEFNKILKVKKEDCDCQNPKGIRDVPLFCCRQSVNPVGQDCPQDAHQGPLDWHEWKFQQGYLCSFLAIFFGLH